ncbi:MAG: formate/nitrite transporter family protein [Clostridiaceae bacterium]|nr:formate/nitrite transporter family protein [Eubacteriales bacterium]
MNMLSPAELTESYIKIGKTKAEKPFGKLFTLAVMAGLIIGLGAAVCNTAVHSIADVSTGKLISGLLFPFGLGMVMLLGAELFTGNVMVGISVLSGKTTVLKMLRNWGVVYLGNLAGAMLLAFACARFGQLGMSHGELAVYTVKVAAAKSSLPFGNALVLGIFCNILVCAGVLCSLSAKDTAGRILGAYIPVAFFVICGFEHCVANMYYIPAGLYALQVPEYAALVTKAGLDVSALTWGNFFLRNLLPVTIGNIIGGLAMGVSMWAAYAEKSRVPKAETPSL